jgi:hypothetical protein
VSRIVKQSIFFLSLFSSFPFTRLEPEEVGIAEAEAEVLSGEDAIPVDEGPVSVGTCPFLVVDDLLLSWA